MRDTWFIEQVSWTAASVVVEQYLLTIQDVSRGYDDYLVITGDTGFIEQVLGAAAPVIVQKDLLTIMDVPRSYDDYFVVVAHTEAAVWAP